MRPKIIVRKRQVFHIWYTQFIFLLPVMDLVNTIGWVYLKLSWIRKEYCESVWPFWRWKFLPIFPFKTNLAKMLLWKTSCSVKINQFLATAII